MLRLSRYPYMLRDLRVHHRLSSYVSREILLCGYHAQAEESGEAAFHGTWHGILGEGKGERG